MIDSHAHLTGRFGDVERGREVDKIILAASNIDESEKNIQLAKEEPKRYYPAVGIHPQCTDPLNKKSTENQVDILDKLIESNRKLIVTVGECGLDATPPPAEERERSRKEQVELFSGQIDLAIKYKLPLMIHARKAVDEVIEILKEFKDAFGVFHCYTGGIKRIKKILDLGKWYFGVDGNITYEVCLEGVVKNIPKDRLLAETDTPFLAPLPFRGQINKPDYVRYVYQKIAELWGVDLAQAEATLDGNAKNLFNII